MSRRLSLLVLVLAALAAPSTDRALAQAPAEPNSASTIAPPPVPQAPFVLNDQEQQLLDAVLTLWEQKSGEITTLQSDFQMLHYNVAFGPPPITINGQLREQPLYVNDGQIRFAKPDKGEYRITKLTKAAAQQPGAAEPTKYEACDEIGEHWVCDGKAVYEKSAAKKQVIEHPLPPQLQGTAISEGPMPFVFGVKAAKLKERYWIKITTPPNAPGQIWLVVIPKRQSDQANFQQAELILNGPDLLPFALNLREPNGDRKMYRFLEPKKNGALAQFNNFLGTFVAPTTPFGWQYIVEPMTAEAPQNGQPQAALPNQPQPR